MFTGRKCVIVMLRGNRVCSRSLWARERCVFQYFYRIIARGHLCPLFYDAAFICKYMEYIFSLAKTWILFQFLTTITTIQLIVPSLAGLKGSPNVLFCCLTLVSHHVPVSRATGSEARLPVLFRGWDNETKAVHLSFPESVSQHPYIIYNRFV